MDMTTINRVIRGGSWDYSGGYCTASNRGGNEPGSSYLDLGFRLCLSAEDVMSTHDSSARVVRGGCWDNDGGLCRSSDRDKDVPDFQYRDCGLRLSLIGASMNTATKSAYVLDALHTNASDDVCWLALADTLEEDSGYEQAELTRLTTMLRHHDTPDRDRCEDRVRELTRQGVRPVMPEIIVLGIKFVLIPPGTFWMGPPEDGSGRSTRERQHLVMVNRPFYMGVYPVTQEQWQAVMGNSPSYFKGDNLPVEQVSWNDCQSFCETFSKKASNGTGWDIHARLPTEAEWEYACRAGTTTPYHTGNGEEALKQAGWYYGNSGNTTHPVGEKLPNAFGLYDMHGNVWEWCQDRFGSDYEGAEEAERESNHPFEVDAGVTTASSAQRRTGPSTSCPDRTATSASVSALDGGESDKTIPFDGQAGSSEVDVVTTLAPTADQHTATGISRTTGIETSAYDSASTGHEDVPLLGSARVVRGGSWNSDGRICRSADRYWREPDNRGFIYGFCIVVCISRYRQQGVG